MQAIVPYAASEVPAWVGTAAQGIKRGRQFYKDHEDKFKKGRKAAKTIQKAWRNRHKGLDAMGHDLGSATAKTDTGTQDNAVTSTRTLNSRALIQLTRGDNINARERDIIDLRGFKFCVQAQNLRTNAPLYVNVAVVSSKFDPTQAPTTAGFFRGENSSRGDNFDVNLQSAEFHCLPINTDKYFIQAHHRIQLAPFNTQQKDYAMKEFYVPIKRQIRFDDSGSGSLNRQFYLVWWCDILLAASGSLPVSTALSLQWKAVTVFREPKV